MGFDGVEGSADVVFDKSRKWGFHFPACHLLSVSGFRVLFDCPLDLSALTVFSPIPTDARQKIEKLLDANNLIQAEPCYKTVIICIYWMFLSLILF
ncbi:hypothetical protein RJ639_042440 [Escallonia herrerae]|uniref:Uncharacterized protein n=1 Tax=Escallonia herrerae TaxID=1293975 RepID=A0AA88WI45_9ASTE|nr:hypothetical protein RJ639_042440 [Escallonia herrerae]